MREQEVAWLPDGEPAAGAEEPGYRPPHDADDTDGDEPVGSAAIEPCDTIEAGPDRDREVPQPTARRGRDPGRRGRGARSRERGDGGAIRMRVASHAGARAVDGGGRRSGRLGRSDAAARV